MPMEVIYVLSNTKHDLLLSSDLTFEFHKQVKLNENTI